MNNKKLSFLLVGLMVLIGYLSSLFLNPKSGVDTLNLALSSKVKNFDPAVVFNDDGLMLLNQAHETLYQYHYLNPYTILPALAEAEPKVSSNGKEWTIKIKKNIYYHDHPCFHGQKRELKAEDFVLAIKRIAFRPLNSPGTWLFKGNLVGFDQLSQKLGKDWKNLLKVNFEGAQAIDSHTLKLRLVKPLPYLDNLLTMTFVSPVPSELVNYFENDLSQVILGTGPYVFKGQEEDRYHFSRNDNFRTEYYPQSGDRYSYTHKLLSEANQQIPFLDFLNFQVVVEAKDRWKLFNDGELHVVSVPNDYIDNFFSSKKLAIQSKQNFKLFSKLNIRWLGFNMSDPVVGKNRDLRLAIAHSIDREEYNRVQAGQTAQLANSIYHPSLVGYSPTKELPFARNLEKAKEYLKKAGYPGGKGLKSLTYTTRGTSKQNLIEANFFKQQLEQIGIKIQIEEVSFQEFLKRGRAGELQIWTDNWYLDYPEASNILQMLAEKNSPGINKSVYSNKKFERQFYRYMSTSDQDERIKLLNEIEETVLFDLPWIMLLYENAYILHDARLKNFRKSYIIRNFLKYLKFE
jgi:ABC-type transport system substrate-binding protein